MMDFNLPKVGIVGGAGPMAGLLLCQKIIQLCQQKYQCQQDADFPYIMLLNYPFADMLNMEQAGVKREIIQEQLNECFKTFSMRGIQLGAIACNTLHAFLNFQPPLKVVHIIEQTAAVLKQKKVKRSLVLCSQTSAQSQLHASYFNCCYPTNGFQQEVDVLIDCILAGQETKEDVYRLTASLQDFYASLNDSENPFGIVLGCTELSVLNDKWPLALHGLKSQFTVVDSTQSLAEGLCESIFEEITKNTK